MNNKWNPNGEGAESAEELLEEIEPHTEQSI